MFGESVCDFEQLGAINRAIGPLPASVIDLVDNDTCDEITDPNQPGWVNVDALCNSDPEIASRLFKTKRLTAVRLDIHFIAKSIV
jgi:hypothetical protein